eukprot:258435_1
MHMEMKINEEKPKQLSFEIPSWYKSLADKSAVGIRCEVIDSHIIRYKSGYSGSAQWWFCMYGPCMYPNYPWYNIRDKVSVKFEFQNSGWQSSHQFGFATSEWWFNKGSDEKNHTARITANGNCYLYDEFKDINDAKNICSQVKVLALLENS